MPREKLPRLYMNFAMEVADLSTCKRSKVGCVVVSNDLEHVYGFGYNGNATGFENTCDNDMMAGGCGCVHAELNAIAKVNVNDKNKVIFCTMSPCLMCAKILINSGFSTFYFVKEYRDRAGLDILLKANQEGIYLMP